MLARLASLRLTLAALVVLALGATAYALQEGGSRAWLAAPLAVLAVNLAAAVLVNRAFRANMPLLVFHLALFALAGLAAAGQLTYLKGRLELSEGELFEGELTGREAGPLHAGALRSVRFVNDGFSIRYAPGLNRAETRNAIRVVDERGRTAAAVIGDNEPLVAAGYRFYTSFNKGFSLVFRWRPAGGAPEQGTVNLPAYPAHEHRQSLHWDLPGGGPRVWTQLDFDRSPLDPALESFFRVPEAHRVVLRLGEARWELRPGERVRLDSGELLYEGARTWMGYNVFYDWTMPWLLAAAVIAAASLGWHFARQFARTPWDA